VWARNNEAVLQQRNAAETKAKEEGLAKVGDAQAPLALSDTALKCQVTQQMQYTCEQYECRGVEDGG
jgi:hypothetical protein